MVTPEEYLEFERAAEYKNEYYNGEIVANSSATRVHARLAVRLTAFLGADLQGKPYEAYSSMMRIFVASAGMFTYSDLSVASSEPQFADAQTDTLLNPIVLVDVRSLDWDKTDRVRWYQEIPSLQEYLVISLERPEVELLRRESSGSWKWVFAKGWDASIELRSIDFTLPLRALYTGILPV